MESKSQELIAEIKEIRQRNKITYQAIMDELAADGIPSVSLTTVRRVFADGSEDKASNFNYETTLLPIAEAINRIAEDSDEIILAKELKACRTEVMQRFDDHINLLKQQLEEKEKLILRLVDRLDQKDDIIHQLIIDMRQKDDLIRHFSNKEPL